jgi:hypothetical protein
MQSVDDGRRSPDLHDRIQDGGLNFNALGRGLEFLRKSCIYSARREESSLPSWTGGLAASAARN